MYAGYTIEAGYTTDAGYTVHASYSMAPTLRQPRHIDKLESRIKN